MRVLQFGQCSSNCCPSLTQYRSCESPGTARKHFGQTRKKTLVCVGLELFTSSSLMRLHSQQAGEMAVNFSGVFADLGFLVRLWRERLA
jgi:hypothetical protein